MPKTLTVVAAVVGLVLCIIGLVYFVQPASNLPAFFPGHQVGAAVHHVKHGIGAVLLALATFAFAWFSSKPSKS